MFILDKRKWCTSLVAVCTRSARHTSAINLKIDCTGKENRCLEIPLRGSFVSIFQNHPAAATCLVRVDDILRPEKANQHGTGKDAGDPHHACNFSRSLSFSPSSCDQSSPCEWRMFSVLQKANLHDGKTPCATHLHLHRALSFPSSSCDWSSLSK